MVWGFCMEYYAANPVDATTRYTRLYLSMFSSLRSWRTSFPKLKGKAAQVKHLAPALAYAWSKLREVGNPKHDAVSLALDMSVQMDRVLDDHPGAVVLPNDASDDFIAVSFVFLNQYTRLATLYNTGGDMVFNVTVKSHMVAHIALRAGDLNPRRAWCFSGERMMLLMRRIAQSCCRGIAAPEFGGKMMSKYVFGLHLVLTDSAEWLSEAVVGEVFRDVAAHEVVAVEI